MKPLTKHSYTNGGYDCVTVGYDVQLDGIGDDEMKVFDALDFYNRPATPEFMGRKIAQLRAVMARTAESNVDISLVVETYSEHLEQYPPDVVAFVIDRTIATKKWFPLIAELRAEMEGLVKFRRALLAMFERKRNPMLAAQPIAGQLEKPIDRHDKPKTAWTKQDWESHISDVEAMLTLSKENPTLFNAEEWQAEVDKRKIEAQAA